MSAAPAPGQSAHTATDLGSTAEAGAAEVTAPPLRANLAVRTGVAGTAVILLVFLGFALSVDFPRAAGGFKGDEATYYSLAHSLARDGDFAFTRDDLIRVWEEYPSGPEGIFLKRGSRISLRSAPGYPFVALERTPVDPDERLYYAKSYIYPLFAAPFVATFGTNGFLVFHALLLGTMFAAGFALLYGRGAPPAAAAGMAAVFIFASVVPIYFFWLTPELFNVALAFLGYFLWAFKLLVRPDRRPAPGRVTGFLFGASSDYAAAILLGIATFSKPTNIVLILPLLAYALWRRQIGRLLIAGLLFAGVVGGLFAVNTATSGELNYQGGQRCSFYGRTGFPFANSWETFTTICQPVATDTVPTDIIFHRDTATVLGWNLLYFAAGRSSGLIPYFFPGVLLLTLFLVRRQGRHGAQWLVLGTLLLGALALLAYMPYTYSGGGGPVGNRYFLSFYPLFLFLAPPLAGAGGAIAALAVGAAFLAKVLLNPLYSSFNPGEHLKAGPLRLLPIERTLLNDLPVSAHAHRARRPLAGPEPVYAYFLDDNAYTPESGFFWVRGGRRAELLLRAPVRQMGEGRVVPLRVRSLTIEITNGAVPNRVSLAAGLRRVSLDLAAGEVRTVTLPPGPGVPYKPSRYPTNYIYALSVGARDGFVPFLYAPGESDDSRFLGAQVRITPVYYNP